MFKLIRKDRSQILFYRKSLEHCIDDYIAKARQMFVLKQITARIDWLF